MAIPINGSGTVSGITAGLDANSMPNGTVLKVFTDTLTSGESLSLNNGQTDTSAAWVDSALDLTCSLARNDSNLLILADIKFQSDINAVYRIWDATSSQIVLGQTGTGGSNQQACSSGGTGADGPNNGNDYGAHPVPCMVHYNPPSDASSRQIKIQFLGSNNAGTVYLGRAKGNSNNMYDTYGPCSLTILEIAA